MELKTYQRETEEALADFLKEARIYGPKKAYEEITSEDERAKRLKGYAGTYRPLKELEDVPYVCLRLPTGGGKTILAARSIKVARENFIEREYPMVLWLVPTRTIRKQTVEALKNERHPYRQALYADFGRHVEVFESEDFANIRPHHIRDNVCIVVATIQALRVNNTEGRKVYAENEFIADHFTGIERGSDGLEPKEDGTPKKSFANLLHIHRPLMIVDEAHKAVTGLSRDMQRRVNPIAIIEYTATPRANSNILYSVSAQELKDEEMIKLPVMLAEHRTWEGAVDGAVEKRAALDAEAIKDRDYIRPIVLFQAEDKGQEVTVEILRDYLIERLNIGEQRIAIATGDQRDLDDIDLFNPDCPIEFIITKEALKEGWDCPFAYVFCSVANIRSATDAEQLLGRVLRMPYAMERKAPALNRAYANLVSKSFADAANALRDKLIDMGFNETEAERNIETEQPELADKLFGRQRRVRAEKTITVETDDDTNAKIAPIAPGRLRIERQDSGVTGIRISGFLKAAEKEQLYAALPDKVEQKVREEIAHYEAENADKASPSEKGETFVVPGLMAMVQGNLEFADTDVLSEHFEWSLTDHPARLEADEFSIVQTADNFEIFLRGDSVKVRPSDQTDQLMLDIPVEGWTEQLLVQLLDKRVRDPMIRQADLIAWLSDVVGYLAGDRTLPLAALMRCRFILARKLREKIAGYRQEEREKAYQACLFEPHAATEISFDNGFRFFDGMFDDVPVYDGDYEFSKHFLGWEAVPFFDGKPGGDEFLCAQAIDSTPEVEYWVRNVSGHSNAFRLPVADGKWTYPDFVGKLKDGRIFVAEYKGGHLVTDARAKRAIGECWQTASNDKGVYAFIEKERDGKSMGEQFAETIA